MLSRLKEEAINAIPAIIYFCIAFNLIHFTNAIGLIPLGIRYYSYFGVTVGALVTGKVLIIVNTLPCIDRYIHKPLIYNIVWKCFLYTFATFLFRVFEIVIHSLYKFKVFSVAFRILKFNLTSPLFWSVQMWLFLVFVIFVIAAEFTRVLGKNKVKEILFRQP